MMATFVLSCLMASSVYSSADMIQLAEASFLAGQRSAFAACINACQSLEGSLWSTNRFGGSKGVFELRKVLLSLLDDLEGGSYA